MLNSNRSAQIKFKTFLVLVSIGYYGSTLNSSHITYHRACAYGLTYGHMYIYVYVIARVGVKFGINFTSVRLSGNKIARGEAECYLPLNLTRVKFVPEISRLTVLLKINTIASLLFIYNVLVLSSLAQHISLIFII